MVIHGLTWPFRVCLCKKKIVRSLPISNPFTLFFNQSWIWFIFQRPDCVVWIMSIFSWTIWSFLFNVNLKILVPMFIWIIYNLVKFKNISGEISKNFLAFVQLKIEFCWVENRILVVVVYCFESMLLLCRTEQIRMNQPAH